MRLSLALVSFSLATTSVFATPPPDMIDALEAAKQQSNKRAVLHAMHQRGQKTHQREKKWVVLPSSVLPGKLVSIFFVYCRVRTKADEFRKNSMLNLKNRSFAQRHPKSRHLPLRTGFARFFKSETLLLLPPMPPSQLLQHPRKAQMHLNPLRRAVSR